MGLEVWVMEVAFSVAQGRMWNKRPWPRSRAAGKRTSGRRGWPSSTRHHPEARSHPSWVGAVQATTGFSQGRRLGGGRQAGKMKWVTGPWPLQVTAPRKLERRKGELRGLESLWVLLLFFKYGRKPFGPWLQVPCFFKIFLLRVKFLARSLR